jgi:hypothetical protein
MIPISLKKHHLIKSSVIISDPKQFILIMKKFSERAMVDLYHFISKIKLIRTNSVLIISDKILLRAKIFCQRGIPSLVTTLPLFLFSYYSCEFN